MATIDFNDGNTVYMNHNTSVMVGTIRVFLGEIFNWITQTGASAEVYTNDLSAAAEGTKFLMRADPRGTTVIVVDGRVRCTPTSGGAWHPVTITQNEQISGTARSYAGPTPVDARRAALWVDQATRLLRRSPVLPQPPQPRVN
jgi:ferric-dicitrate binding protein FerR (iron transport regulator)